MASAMSNLIGSGSSIMVGLSVSREIQAGPSGTGTQPDGTPSIPFDDDLEIVRWTR